MKHAINELKALLDTWGGQKEQSWNDGINDAIRTLEAEQYANEIVERKFGKIDLSDTEYEQQNADAVEKNGLHEETVSLTGSEFDGQLQPPGVKALFERCGSGMIVVPPAMDDDLGELDPSKACGFGEEGCTSCQ